MSIQLTSDEIKKTISKIGDINLMRIWNNNNNKYIPNITLLSRYMICNILGINNDPNNNNIIFNDKQIKMINKFLDNTSDAISDFCDILDYDQDGVVELVKIDENGNKVKGDDIKLISENIKDIKNVVSPFKKNGSLYHTVIAILTNIYVYFTNDKFTETCDDFVNFRESCKIAYKSFNDIKKIDGINVFTNKKEDLMKLIILLCVISIPIIDIVSKRIANINMKKKTFIEVSPEEYTITNKEIYDTFIETYGSNLDFIMVCIDKLVVCFMKYVKTKKIYTLFKALSEKLLSCLGKKFF